MYFQLKKPRIQVLKRNYCNALGLVYPEPLVNTCVQSTKRGLGAIKVVKTDT